MIYTAAAAIFQDNKILMVKRVENTELFPGCWAFPGGKAEINETPEQNVIREVREETNLEFHPTELFMTNYFEDRKMYRFLGTWTGQIKLQEEELSDYGWFDYLEATKLSLAFDYLEVIKYLNKIHLLQ